MILNIENHLNYFIYLWTMVVFQLANCSKKSQHPGIGGRIRRKSCFVPMIHGGVSCQQTQELPRPQTAAVPRLKAWTIVDSACVAGYNMTWQGSKPAVGDQWAINGYKCDMGIYIMMYFGYIQCLWSMAISKTIGYILCCIVWIYNWIWCKFHGYLMDSNGYIMGI